MAKILLATTCRWITTARQALAFSRAGCMVEAVCPPDHPVSATRVLEKSYRYNGLTPLYSFRKAILASRPDLILPGDDLAVKHLHGLYDIATSVEAEGAEIIRSLIEVSLGDPASYPITASRDNFMAMIYTEGVRAPETRAVYSEQEVTEWVGQYGFPAVLKADGTSGGEGVRIVHTLADALRAYRSLHAPVTGIVAMKRAFFDRDWNCAMPWLAQRKRMVSIQSFVTGPDANVAVACWEGRILSSISVEVLETWRPKGPATIVRLIENAEMNRAVEKIVYRLNFSGLCGFDFLIDKSTGNAYLIEMNARATQTCPLPLGRGRDLVTSLSSIINGQTTYRPSIELLGDTIALFPLAWQGDTSRERFQSAYHDIPWEEPELVRWGMKQIKETRQEEWVRLFAKVGLYQAE